MSRRPNRRPLPDEAVAHLRAGDPVMAGIIDRVGVVETAHEPDLWWGLVDAIASQQVSVAAATSILRRIAELGANGRPTPEEVVAMPDERLRGAGLSGAKTRYVRDLAQRWLDGDLEVERMPEMDDDEVIEHLVRVKGIGRWTAEMVLMFCLGREDVLAVDDLGLRRAMQVAYDLPERPDPDEMRRIAEPWRPYRSAASIYLWRSV